MLIHTLFMTKAVASPKSFFYNCLRKKYLSYCSVKKNKTTDFVLKPCMLLFQIIWNKNLLVSWLYKCCIWCLWAVVGQNDTYWLWTDDNCSYMEIWNATKYFPIVSVLSVLSVSDWFFGHPAPNWSQEIFYLPNQWMKASNSCFQNSHIS